jgi:immunoglobulin-binding protein 1
MSEVQENLENLTLSEQLSKAKSLLDDDDDTNNNINNNINNTDTNNTDGRIIESINLFESLQHKIHLAALFSRNESLDDIPTSSLSLLSVEYHLAKAFLQLRIQSSKDRLKNVNRAIELFHLFLSRCHDYDSLLNEVVAGQYSTLISIHDAHHGNGNDDGNDTTANINTNTNIPQCSSSYHYTLPPQSRDDKIQNYKITKSTSAIIANYKSKLDQRTRLSLSQDEEFDGYDYDTLLRSLTIQELNLYAFDSISEIYSTSLELQMLNMSMKDEERLQHEHHYRHGQRNRQQQDEYDNQKVQRRRHPDNNQSNKPMTLTHVTQDPVTNQLLFQKEVVQKTIFRPSWNQPTMSLSELGEKEMKEAQERSERQAESEKEKMNQPRRYEYLLRDGLEDDDKLVDASAKIDREWDNWKDENPRGSGNKMGDVGDRNF